MDQNQLERLLGVGPALAEGLDLETVLRRIIDAAREVTGARYAALGVLDAAGAMLERFITAGLTEDEIARIGDLPRGRGVLGELIRHPQPLRLKTSATTRSRTASRSGTRRCTRFLGVPIRVRGEVYGNLYLTEKAGAASSTQDDEETVAAAGRLGGHRHRQRAPVRERRARATPSSSAPSRCSRRTSRSPGRSAPTTELEPVLELVVKRGRALVEARGVALA